MSIVYYTILVLMGPGDQWDPGPAYAKLTHCNTLLTQAYAGRRSKGGYKKQLTRAYAGRVFKFQMRGSSNQLGFWTPVDLLAQSW